MSSAASTVVKRIRTDLRGIDGTGSYTWSVAGDDDRVHIASLPDSTPPTLPRIYISDVGVQSNQGERASLRQYRRTLTCTIVGVIGASDTTPGSALLNAMDLMDDITRAIEADRTLKGNVIDAQISGITLSGEALGLSGTGICIVSITAPWLTTTGV